MNIEKLSLNWIESQDNDDKLKDNHSIDYVIDMSYEENLDELWKFIKITYKQNISDKVISSLAAGPLEDLLSKKGETYIKEVETLSRQDPKFKGLLGGVWQNSMSNEIWERVCKARGTLW